MAVIRRPRTTRPQSYRDRYRPEHMDPGVPRRLRPRMKVPTRSAMRDGRRIMGGGVPPPGNLLGALGRAWMDRGRTVTPGRGPVGWDRSILNGTLGWAADYARSVGRYSGLIRPRVSKRAGRLARP